MQMFGVLPESLWTDVGGVEGTSVFFLFFWLPWALHAHGAQM